MRASEALKISESLGVERELEMIHQGIKMQAEIGREIYVLDGAINTRTGDALRLKGYSIQEVGSTCTIISWADAPED